MTLSKQPPGSVPVGYDHLSGPDPFDDEDQAKMRGELDQLSEQRDAAVGRELGGGFAHGRHRRP